MKGQKNPVDRRSMNRRASDHGSKTLQRDEEYSSNEQGKSDEGDSIARRRHLRWTTTSKTTVYFVFQLRLRPLFWTSSSAKAESVLNSDPIAW